ncbi:MULTISPECIES: phage shock envelope stress response protein PspM [Prauserella salsuginis group]|uniref:Uncharacterized protein n=2 Tax=Prauserella salsuginis group TaxID=2893672 RepID=A0A839XVH7_9PSEU|nr:MULTISPECIES: hypothetical protein [Prauserella salsuginis group]MBB3665058.1 hypothetical protein [Prauserella sediminis]MCR3718529.1 hypothetical protein [Prauserella flava]MCR3733099.1 hypothetical protein [Prauserella salsuginis]
MAGKSGRRDFSELTAKLGKHVERLPDYAQKAQEKVQKYLPPEDQRASGSADRASDRDGDRTGRSDGARTGGPPAPRPKVDLTVVTDVRDKLAAWNSPEAKHARRVRWTRRAFTLWAMLTLLAVLWAVAGYFGVIGAYEGVEGALTGAAGTVVFGALAVSSGTKLRRLGKVEPPRPDPASMLPPTGSAARAPMEKLVDSERTLTDLLDQLATPQHGAPSGATGFDVEDARATAMDASAALRGLAARLESIERARDAAPARERDGLDSAVTALREQLDEGLEGYGALVAAAGRAVAASSDGASPAKDALTDATDRLAGLAVALRELS